jgi:hypothetical protein
MFFSMGVDCAFATEPKEPRERAHTARAAHVEGRSAVERFLVENLVSEFFMMDSLLVGWFVLSFKFNITIK